MKNFNLLSVLGRRADAEACISGSEKYPCVKGKVKFYQLCGEVLVAAEVWGLPLEQSGGCRPVFGFHIHEGKACSGSCKDPFSNAKGHYNPDGCSHPYHAGDMPPLFGAGGNAFLAFVTDRFEIDEIMGRAVIVHGMSDDFHTQPSGDSGERIACGIVNRVCG